MSKFSSTPGAGWATPSLSVFQLGKGKTLAVPMDVHVASRKKLVKRFHDLGITSGIVLLQGGEEQCQYDTDTDILFRQDSWFNYLFGAKEGGMYGAINLKDGATTLFIPKLSDEYRIWCGEIYPPEHFRQSYLVDEVLFTESLCDWLNSNLTSGSLHLMSGVNSDSGTKAKHASFDTFDELSEAGKIDMTVLYNELSSCRVIKSPEEIEVMRYCANVASNAHATVMREYKTFSIEYEIEAKFLYEIYRNGGCRRSAYVSICACGPNSAVLHYGHAGAPNDRVLKPTDMALLDMGSEYHGYVSDITCSFPMAGVFSEDQRTIYEGVLNAQIAVLEFMKPGVSWGECHLIAERQIINALVKAGVLHNGSLEEYVDNHLGPVFFPHGLGHLIGCDTHDVGGYIAGTPARASRAGLSKLRTARILQAGMTLTNEPGCYFIDALLDKALADESKAKFINTAALERFRGFGGVRLEDVVVVTETGVESLSTCPRTVEEVEGVLAGGAWPPSVDKAPQLKRCWTKLSADATKMEMLSL